MTSAADPGSAGVPSAQWPETVQRRQAAARDEAFGYVCHRCSRCCHDKLIQVNPYEVARLARCLGVSTGAFAAEWTENGAGLHLARRDDGACVFLGPDGCGVHIDRPLVCRIYPLGRHVDADGAESWSHLAPHPRTAGVYSKSGAISDYLVAQGAYTFMQAADEYTTWLRRAAEVLKDDAQTGVGAAAPAESIDLLDMDTVIAAHAAERGEAAPVDIEARKDLHLQLLNRLLEQSEGDAR